MSIHNSFISLNIKHFYPRQMSGLLHAQLVPACSLQSTSSQPPARPAQSSQELPRPTQSPHVWLEG